MAYRHVSCPNFEQHIRPWIARYTSRQNNPRALLIRIVVPAKTAAELGGIIMPFSDEDRPNQKTRKLKLSNRCEFSMLGPQRKLKSFQEGKAGRAPTINLSI